MCATSTPPRRDLCVRAGAANRDLARDLPRAQVLTLTSDGPIGKFVCRLRTLMVLCLTHMRLLKELFEGAFAGRPAPNKHMLPMTLDDPLDFVDFTEVRERPSWGSRAMLDVRRRVESSRDRSWCPCLRPFPPSQAMARNVPQKHVEGTNLFYGWMYSPEVHATPEVRRGLHPRRRPPPLPTPPRHMSHLSTAAANKGALPAPLLRQPLAHGTHALKAQGSTAHVRLAIVRKSPPAHACTACRCGSRSLGRAPTGCPHCTSTSPRPTTW